MFLGHDRDEGQAWSARDRELAKALLLHEADQCSGCGHPLSETLDPEREGWYDVHEDICAGCLALEKHAEREEREPGARVTVTLAPDYKPGG